MEHANYVQKTLVLIVILQVNAFLVCLDTILKMKNVDNAQMVVVNVTSKIIAKDVISVILFFMEVAVYNVVVTVKIAKWLQIVNCVIQKAIAYPVIMVILTKMEHVK